MAGLFRKNVKTAPPTGLKSMAPRRASLPMDGKYAKDRDLRVRKPKVCCRQRAIRVRAG